MEWILAIGLFLIISALWTIGNAINNLVKVLQAKQMFADPSHTDLSGIEEKLDSIFKIMGGEEKIKTQTERERKELKEKLIPLLMSVQNKTQAEAKKDAEEKMEDAIFEEEHESYPSKMENLKHWVNAWEIEEHNKKKYGHLLPKIRKLLEGKEKVFGSDGEDISYETIGTDYEGRKWLIEKMVQEKRLSKKTEYHYEEADKLLYYEVLKVE